MDAVKKKKEEEFSKTGTGSVDTNSFQRNSFTDQSPAHTALTQLLHDEDTLVMEMKQMQKKPAALLLLNGPKELIGKSWFLEEKEILLGRSFKTNDISIAYPSLSKNHFKIIKEDDEIYIMDLGSTNKTYVQDKELVAHKKTLLKNNDYIQASSLIFKYLEAGSIESLSSQEMLKKTQVDPLTGAGNRLLLNVKVNDYFISSEDFSMIVFDIDNFKSINDEKGHLAGDYVLKIIAKEVFSLIREQDLFIRYGGDEFCILCPEPLHLSQNIAKRIENQIKNHKFSFKGKDFTVNISIGVAEQCSKDKSWKDIYHRADKLAYEEKNRKKALRKKKVS